MRSAMCCGRRNARWITLAVPASLAIRCPSFTWLAHRHGSWLTVIPSPPR
jgi:hypothetical protein